MDMEVSSNGMQIFCQCGELLGEHIVAARDSSLDSLDQRFKNEDEAAETPLMKGREQAMMPEANLSKTTRQFGDYTILKLLGEGGMGKVYLVHDNTTNERGALKVLKKINDSKLLQYFQREAQILTQLDHPNIVKIKCYGIQKDYPYLLMEYIVGSTLSKIIQERPNLHPASVAQIGYYLLLALEYANQKKIIHRDIKPGNIFITSLGVLKLIDMGMSKALDESYQLSKTGQIIGTPYYAPYEQLQDSKHVGHRSDLYAVGATLFQTLSGKVPFIECGTSLSAILTAKASNTYKRLTDYSNQFPPKLVQIIEKAMAFKPEDRYSNATEMKESLHLFCRATGKQQQKQPVGKNQ
jgi:serine/threonine-protein kinase